MTLKFAEEKESLYSLLRSSDFIFKVIRSHQIVLRVDWHKRVLVKYNCNRRENNGKGWGRQAPMDPLGGNLVDKQ